MNSLAVPDRNGASAPQPQGHAAHAQMFVVADVWELALKVAESRLFPNVTTPQQAFTLMMLCQADGLHPMHALRRYHIIEGRPSMRADAMQAEFQAHGGRIKILRCDELEARAVFSHREYQPDGFEMSVTYAQFEKSKMIYGKEGVKKNWRESPSDMLWARLVTKGIRRIDPGIVVGIYSEDEVEDVLTTTAAVHAMPPAATPAIEAARAEAFGPDLPGQPPGADDRPYHQVVTDVVRAGNDRLNDAVQTALGQVDFRTVVRPLSPGEIHAQILNRAIQLGHDSGTVPTKNTERIQRLTKVYKEHRGFVRAEIASYLGVVERDAAEAIAKEGAARQAEAPGAETDAEAPDDLETTEAGSRG